MPIAFTTPDGPDGARVDLVTPGGVQTAVMTTVSAIGPTGPTGPTGPAGGGATPASFSFADDFDYVGTADPAALPTAGVNVPTGQGNWFGRAITAAGLINVQSASGTNHPGTISLSTSTTINSIGYLQRGVASVAAGLFIGSAQIDQIQAVVRTDSAATVRDQIGATSTPSSVTPSNAMMFVFDSSLGGNWLCVCRSGGVETSVDSGVAVVAATFYNLAIKQAVVGTVTFEINGAQVASINTNVPAATVNVGMLVQTLAAAARTFLLDFFALTSKALVR